MENKIKCNKCNGEGYINGRFQGVIKIYDKYINSYMRLPCDKCHMTGRIDWIDELFD